MNMDELKLIAETIGKLGEAGQSAFGWWLLADKVLPSVCWLAVILALCYTAYRVTLALNRGPLDTISLLEKANEAVRTAWLYGDTEHDSALYDMHKKLQSWTKEGHRHD